MKTATIDFTDYSFSAFVILGIGIGMSSLVFIVEQIARC